jgi:hypothetical protein
MSTIVAQFPLIFEVPVENLIKYSLAIFYVTLQIASFKYLFGISFDAIMPLKNKVFGVLFVLLEIYKTCIHEVRSITCYFYSSF